MFGWKRWTATAAVGGALLLGGLGVAVSQQAEAPGLDVDELATRMQLDDGERADLERVAQLMERQMEVREQMRQLHGEMAGAMSSLHERLTPEQRKELHGALHEAMHDGAAMMGGHMGMGMRGHMGMRSGMGMMGMHGGMGQDMHAQGAGHHHAACPWAPDASEDAGESSGS